ncbi:MAG: selenide, water dikinase SelD [Proteobacteria bacterium]|nr:selenide, water dikinase SelD [Pseudomonadota bacterium]
MLKKRLILLGGGHTHALLLRRLTMKPIFDLEVLLISPESISPYSGMLPGHLEGLYSHEDMHIDLQRLCAATGTKFIQAAALGIDKESSRVIFSDRPALYFDLLSINIGSIPKKANWGLGIKPLHAFFENWHQLETAASIAIIGGGVGGIEVALSLNKRFGDSKKISLFHKGSELLENSPKAVRKKLTQIVLHRGIQVVLNMPNAEDQAKNHDLVLWTTAAKGPDTLRNFNLKLDERGFLLTDDHLRCLGEKNIFAVGDCAHIVEQYRPRSGVYAVRQAPLLETNIRRHLKSQTLKKIRLQKNHLILLSTGGRQAIALRGKFYWQAKWIWPLKDHIDRQFMDMFKQISTSPMPQEDQDPMRCLGCGAKISGHMLRKVLANLRKTYPTVFSETDTNQSFAMHEDVSLVQTQGWLMQSLDYFPSFIDDAFLLGKIACLHASGDIIAKGGVPRSCLVLAVLPHKAPSLLEDDFYQVLAGIAEVLQTMGTRLLGGHSAEGKQLALGLQVQGEKPDLRHWKPKSGLRAGDRLIMTKALGTGLILAGLTRLLSKGSELESCIQSMLLNHFKILPLIIDESVHGATDITGFGLLGHLAEMVQASGVSVAIWSQKIPRLQGVDRLLALSVQSTLALDNQIYAESLCTIGSLKDFSLFCDPQTSGALLLSVDADFAASFIEAAHQAGFTDCAIIGEVRAGATEIAFL